MTTRRLVLTRSAAVIGAASSGLLLPQIVRAQSDKLRVGFMLPYTGTFAQLGVAIENGFRMALNEQGGKLGGREVEFFKVDDESNPAKGIENATRLVQRDKVDVLVGTVHSGVQMGIHKVVRESVAALSGIAQGLSLVHDLDIDVDEAEALLSELRLAMKALRNLDATLKELVNGK